MDGRLSDLTGDLTYNVANPDVARVLPGGWVLPAGNGTTTITARYDNSTGNPNNPNNPPKRVTWGEQTTDEMCVAFVGVTVDSENLAASSGKVALAGK